MRIQRKLIKAPVKPFEKVLPPLLVPLRLEPFDVVICVAPKDYFKLKYCVSAVFRCVPGFETVHVISPTEIEDKTGLEHPKIVFHLDQAVLPVSNLKDLKYRPGWIYQQFIKLFQQVSKNNYYLTVDSDVIFNRRLEFFTQDGRPIWYYGWDQNNPPYFGFQEKMIGIGKICPNTFICDMNFFSRTVIENMLERYGHTMESFIQKSIEIIDSSCYIAEPEIYGNYVAKFFPGLYEIVRIKDTRVAREQFSATETLYSEREFAQILEDHKGLDYDIVAIHSWFNEKVQ
jgi:hypothetical protein